MHLLVLHLQNNNKSQNKTGIKNYPRFIKPKFNKSMVDKESKEKVSENLDITDELIAERRTSSKMPEDMTPWMAKTIIY